MNLFCYLRRKTRKLEKQSGVMAGKYGLLYNVDSKSALDYHIVQFGILNDYIGTRIGEFVTNNAVIFDVGANVGLLTLPFSAQASNGRVYAFEPDAQNYEQLCANIKLNNNIHNIIAEQMAVQDDPELKAISLNVRRAIDGDGLENRGLSTIQDIPNHYIDSYSVPCTTIDEYVVKYCLANVDFIKIDVEGAEYRVMKGAENTIKTQRPIILYEFSKTIDRVTNSKTGEFYFNFLKVLNYIQFQIDDEKTLKEINSFEEIKKDCNIIAKPKQKVLPISSGS